MTIKREDPFYNRIKAYSPEQLARDVQEKIKDIKPVRVESRVEFGIRPPFISLKEVPVFSKAEISKHNRPDDYWKVEGEEIHDLSFLSRITGHPWANIVPRAEGEARELEEESAFAQKIFSKAGRVDAESVKPDKIHHGPLAQKYWDAGYVGIMES